VDAQVHRPMLPKHQFCVGADIYVRTSRGRTRTGTGVTPQGILSLLRGLPRAIEDCHQTTGNTVFSGVFLHLYIVGRNSA
jgi:hypothetical protein